MSSVEELQEKTRDAKSDFMKLRYTSRMALSGDNFVGGVDPSHVAMTKGQSNFIQKINDNKFWLVHHFVPSHDVPPKINAEKYGRMFQYDLLKQKRKISLKIPPHNAEHNAEIDVMRKKEKGEDYDGEDAKIRI